MNFSLKLLHSPEGEGKQHFLLKREQDMPAQRLD